MRRCAGLKRDGTQCTVSVDPPQTYCWWHEPANSERRKRAAAKGGKAKASKVTKDLNEALDDLMNRVVDGSLAPYRGSVAAQLVNTRIRLLEYERKLKEAEEFEAWLQELERSYALSSGGYS